jgi:hypothetical protein
MAIRTYPHGPLKQLASNLWVVSAKTSQGIDRKMTVARSPHGDLFLHDALWLDDKTFLELDGLGRVATVFVPSFLHDFDGQRFADRYPGAHFCAMPATRKRLKWPRLMAFETSMAPAGITITELPGLRINEVVAEVQHPEGGISQIYTDALLNLAHGKGARGWFFRMIGSTGPLHMTPIARLLLRNKAAFKRWLADQGTRKDIKHVIVGHGRVVSDDVSALLTAAAERL